MHVPRPGWLRNGTKLRPEDRAVHDWYRFVLSFPSHLVRDYLHKFGTGASQLVLDPFCGTGTTLVECKKMGIPSVGVERNPMARFASQTKVDWSVDPRALQLHAKSIAARALEQLHREGVDESWGRALVPSRPSSNRHVAYAACRQPATSAEELDQSAAAAQDARLDRDPGAELRSVRSTTRAARARGGARLGSRQPALRAGGRRWKNTGRCVSDCSVVESRQVDEQRPHGGAEGSQGRTPRCIWPTHGDWRIVWNRHPSTRSLRHRRIPTRRTTPARRASRACCSASSGTSRT